MTMTSTTTTAKAEQRLENAIGELYAAMYQLRQLGEYRKEYDAMGTILTLMCDDRASLLKLHGDKIYANV